MAQISGLQGWLAAVVMGMVPMAALAQDQIGADDFPTGLTPGTAAPNQSRDPGEATIRLPSPVLTIDWEQLFDGTLWGKRIMADLARDTDAQKAENDRIADQLIAEEKALTDERGKIDAAVFQAKADAFDARATKIRAEQSAKGKALEQRYSDERNAFFGAMLPYLDEILRRRGAVVVLDQRAVIRALPEADVTPDMIALVDARVGDGPPEDDPDPAGAPAQPAAPAASP